MISRHPGVVYFLGDGMKGRLGLFAASLFAMGSSAVAVPTIGTFEFDDVAIMGCSAVAGDRGSKGWDGPKYAVWKIGSSTPQETMTMKFNGSLESFAVNISNSSGPKTTIRVTGRWRGYNILLLYTPQKRTGYETMTGTGAIRVFSDTPGDSKSVPVTVNWGC